MVTSKIELNDLINKLSDQNVPLVADRVNQLLHPVDDYISYDDEPLTDDDIQSIKEGREEFAKVRLLNLRIL